MRREPVIYRLLLLAWVGTLIAPGSEIRAEPAPGDMNGIFVNGREVFRNEGPKYRHYAHRITLDDVSPLRRGENTLATGASPRGHHGMEVNWPGIMVLIRYRTEAE